MVERKPMSKGVCSYCGTLVAKSAINAHLKKCADRQAAIQKAERGKLPRETLYHLRVEADGLTMFWLDLEMRGSAHLEDLDGYLRAIWLECCGHMSQFSVGGWTGDEIAKRRRIDEVLRPGVKLTHIYDFGTESVTLIKSLETREGRPASRHPIALMARNQMPESICSECDQPATHLCMECVAEYNLWNVMCARHIREHPHDNYGEPIELVNSPRVGLCGYTGPADPPY
ncbi:MAG: hypothetical protein HZB53_07005 [Chloroflexi bacterium]|nr:hypothetical protein [Chloroflexota bacterium]